MSCGKRRWSIKELREFEKEIAALFLAKRIRAPIHLSDGNEAQLIEIFQSVEETDTILSTHRNHYTALLKGISPEWLKQEILEGRSMHIMNAEHRFLASSIVGGICPIAVGIAQGIKMQGEKRRVWCFVGDMAGQSGIFHESAKYAKNFNLPATFVVEDNHYSTNTPTAEAWGLIPGKEVSAPRWVGRWQNGGILYYSYRRRSWGHVGVGQFVRF